MTNYEKLIQMSIYDLLYTLNDNMLDIFAFCVMEVLPDKYEECPYNGDKHMCRVCISKWLDDDLEL